MAHWVICPICNIKFDRDKEAYVQPATRRYAHASCYLRERQLKPELPELKITDPTDFVTCIYCKKNVALGTIVPSVPCVPALSGTQKMYGFGFIASFAFVLRPPISAAAKASG